MVVKPDYADNARQPKWTEPESEWLGRHYLSMPYSELAEHLGRSESAVAQRLNQMGLRKSASWTGAQLDLLRRNYASAVMEELRTMFGHPLFSVIKKAGQLGLRRQWGWTDDEFAHLGELAGQGMPDGEIAHHLDRSVCAVTQRRRESGVLLKSRWTEAEDDLLKRRYGDTAKDGLAELLPGRSPNAIGKRASQLGLGKPEIWPEQLDDLMRRRYPISTIPELLELLPGKTRRQIKRRAQQLGLRKDPATLAKCFHMEDGQAPPQLPGRNSRWRNAVLKRDGFRCQECGCAKDRLSLRAHHIVPQRDPRCAKYDIGNGICLCADCHDSIKGREHEVRDRYLAIVALKQEKP
jgi:hypothetical protein